MKAENKIQPEGILEQDVELFSHKDISEDNILFEDVKKRDERTKHFRTKDGKYIAATFRNPIHVLDESTGEYVDIADTFEEKDDCFETKNPRYNARFPKEDSEASFVSIEKNGRSVDWHFRSKNSAKKKASVKKKEKHAKLECDAFPSVRYEGNSDDCVLEYKLTESGIKEDIILFSRPEKSEFEFDFKIKGLDAVLDDEKKTIKLFANGTESVEPEFVLPKIVMFDASGVYSEDAHYEIEEHGNKLTVKVVASDEWLLSDERVYPVTIDPQVNTTDDSALVRSYANVFSNGTTYTGSSSFRVGIDENQLESLLCCKTTFPSLPQGAKIISATLNLKNTSYHGMAKYEVFPITESWETSSVKWSNMPKVDYNSPCGTFVSATEDILRVDITAGAKNYYRNNSTVKGLLIKHNCSCIDEDEKCPFDSAQYITISATEINYIAVEYMLMDEYTDHQAQKSFEVGRAGVGSVNIFTGKLHFVHNDINESGGHLPLSLSHIYNSAYNEIGENDVIYGKGWHLSAAQTFAYDMHNNQYIYVDANGRKHYLKPSGATADASHVIFSDTAGLGLTYVDGEGTVEDEKGNKLNFIGEKLYSISDAYNHKITYEYTGDLVTKVTDSVGRTSELTYDSYGKLIRITDDKKRNTTFNYTSNYLVSIVYPDGSTTVFEYSNSVLTKVTDYTGTGYEISYDGNENDMRVSSVSQFGTLKISHNSTSAKNIIGGGANFEYYAFSSAVEDDVTKIKTVYRFDTCGRTLFSYEDLTDSNINISDITVTNIKDYDVKHDKYNQPTTGKYLSVNAAITGIDAKYPNLLANNSFDSNAVGTLKPSNWSIGSHCANHDGVVAEGYITEEKTHKAYKFNNKCSYSNKTLTQTIELAETALDGNMLIVSAWAKANKPVNNSADSSTAKFELNAILSYDEHENLEKTVKFDYLCTDWQYVAIPIEIPPGIGYVPTKIQVKFDFSGNSGTCLLSNVRVTPVRGMYTNISHGTWTFDDVECKRKVVQYDGLNSTQTYYDEKSDLVRKQEYFTSDSGALNSFVTSYEYDLKHRITKSKDYRNIVTENTYDNNGNLIKQKVYNSADNSVYMVTEAAYDELGNVITAYDPRDKDINTEYCYSESECDLDNLLRNHVDPNNQRYNYGYNESNKLRTSVTAVKSSTISSNIENLFGYTRNSLTQITHNGFNYNFDYDSLGRLSGVEIAGNEVLTRTYTNGKNSTVTTTFGELGTTNVTSDSRGNPTKKTINGVEVASARYDERGNITQLVDNLKNVCYKYYYYGDGNLRKITQCDLEDDTVIDTQTFTYDSAKRPVTHTDSATGFEYTTEYEKKGSRVYPDNVPCAVTLSGKYTDRVVRDGLRRVSEKKLTLDSKTNALMREQFSYLAGESGNTTEFVSKIEQTVGSYAYDLSYTYDSMGNVSQVRENGTLVASYTYDSLNQLIAEFNYAKGFKYTYEYDRGGNITTKRRICISDCSLDKEYTYTYASDWKDKLISFDGESIVYDAIGNPTTYRGNNLTWTNVRHLASFGNNTYEYGADGIRTSKTVNNVMHSYTLDDSNIIMETYGSNTIKYFYGSSGITGFSYNGIDYYYRKNLQGDITAIHGIDGTRLVSYRYDAWGNILEVYDASGIGLSTINPFRYRGYYYDTETGLYYLNSRYYDPETGRFINADSLEYLGANGDFVNYNLFAVCMSMLPKSYKLHNILSKRPSERIDKHKNSFRSSAYRQLASYSTAKSGNTAVSSKETFIFANHVFRNHYTTPTAMLDFGPLWGKVGFSSTITKQNVEPGLFYSFSDIGLDQAKYGVGLNIVGWLGVNVGINTEGNAFVGAQVTPWLHAEASVGLDGIGITVGIDVEDTSFDFEIKLGLGTCAVIACIIFAPYAAPILAACLV